MCVTWTFGHLCSLLEPHDYSPAWKHWCLSALPMLPQRYDIKLIDDDGIRRQFGVIKTLIGQAEEIINCGDAGQEGELIQRWVMKLADTKCPVRRLWISSLTDESIRDGFRDLKPQADFDRLFFAGLSRAIGDWVLGMNATRLYSLKYSTPGHVLSIGRVQTPTLALIVRRQREIENFVPRDSWELHTMYREVNFTSTGDRFDTEEAGEAVRREIVPETFTVTGVTKKKGREAPPRLFDLTSLQVECNKKFSWSADTTLRLIQSLYEKKLTTYPRVDTTYLSDDIHPKIAPTLRAMTPYAKFTESILAKPIPKSKKVFDNSKVTDHHAIIPTGQNPSGIEGDEKKLYHLIAMRFIAAFYPDCQFEQTTVTGRAGKCDFKAGGKVILDPGWRVLYPSKGDKNEAEGADDSEEGILPPFVTGESGPHSPFLCKKTSQPPKYYTEGTLLRAMETAGRTVDDEELREAMKDNGIGRPSTRAAIIETLFKRRYIYRERKNIVASQAGIDLIDTINEELLKSAKLTGLWENKLRRIERGDYSPAAFVREINELVRTIVTNVMNDNGNRRIVTAEPVASKPAKGAKGEKSPAAAKPRAPRITKLEQVKCPQCGTGHIVRGRTAFGCSNYASGCRFLLPFSECPADTKPGALNRKINSSK
ncbi:MAG: DNA topoisomerase III [Muribaculaceae bacterium]|nr:DNA topoisomerase III [Muribaculaceae bacterium]